jgi:hypothetical protein
MQLRIDPEFHALIPPLSADERAELRASLQAEGCRDKLIAWNGTIIDGHNRYELCQELGISFEVDNREFDDRAAAMLWMIRNQFARRNLPVYMRAQLVSKAKPVIAAQAKAQQGKRTDISQNSVESPIDTQKELATLAGVSHDTIHKVEIVEREAPEQIKQKARNQEMSANRAYRMTQALKGAEQDVIDVVAKWDIDEPDTVEILKRLKASSEKSSSNGTWEGIVHSGYIQPGDEEDAVHINDSPSKIRAAMKLLEKSHKREYFEARRAELQSNRITNYPGPGFNGIIHGNMRDVGAQIPDNSIDLIFTDPPYPQEFLPLFGELSTLANRVLKPGGVCIAYSGQIFLPQVMDALGTKLDYLWTCAIRHTGGNERIFKANVNTGWKPLLMFVKPPLKPYWDSFIDIVSGGKEKSDHEWQQAEAEAAHFVKALCPAGGVVLDPFAGSGTTLVAAKKLGLGYIGIEIDIEHVVKVEDRLNDT